MAARSRARATQDPVRATPPLLLGALVGALVAGRWETGVLCLLTAIAGAVRAGARPPAARWLLGLCTSALVAWLLNLYLVPGAALAGWPRVLGRVATAEGGRLGGLLTLRLAGAFVAMQGLRAAWTADAAADAIARALAPLERFRVPVGETRAMLGLALRFAPLLQTEAMRIARVQELRAGRPPRGAREWLERRRAALVPTLVGSLERAERVSLALEARHYRGPVRPARPEVHGAPLAAKLAGIALAATALAWRG